MSLWRTRQTITFCATGIFQTYGGIASANRNILIVLQDAARAKGLALNVLVLHERNDHIHYITDDRVSYHAFHGRIGAFTAAMLRRLIGCHFLVFDHVHLAQPILAVPQVFRPPVVIFAHGSESSRRIRRSSMRLFQQADRVLTNSHYTLRRMRETFDAFNGTACPLGLPPQSVLQMNPSSPLEASISLPSIDGPERMLGERVLILVGRMDPGEGQKGHRELIRVLPRLRATFPDVQLLFVGPGDDRAALSNLARQEGVGDAVLLTNAVADEVLQQLYQRSYALVMPSRQEGFGLVYLEAMNWAKPCLACFDDGGAEIVVDGETGVLVHQPLDLDELYKALARLLENPEEARRFGKAGWRRLHQHYTAKMYQERLKAEFDAMLK